MKNKYVIRCRISEKKFREILRLFCLDIEACKVAQITGISRPATNRLYTQIRQHIAEQCERVSPFEEGAVELDESYFGRRRVRGKRGRGAAGKVPVFGMLGRGGKSIRRSSKTALWLKYCRLSGKKSDRIRSFIPMDSKLTMGSPILDINDITASDMGTTSLHEAAITSTALRIFGAVQSAPYPLQGHS